MSLSTFGLISGITCTLIVFTAAVIGLILLKAYSRSHSSQTLGLSLFILFMGSPWLGSAINFILAVVGASFLDDVPYVMLTSFWVFGSLAAIQVTSTILLPSWEKRLVISFGVISVVQAFAIFILVPLGVIDVNKVYDLNKTAGNLPEGSYAGVFIGLVGITVITVIICGIFFIVNALMTEIPLIKARSTPLGIGMIIYALFAVIDGAFSIKSEPLLIYIRFMVLLSLLLIYVGITLPSFIFARWGIEKPPK